jgi:hypothetical protein
MTTITCPCAGPFALKPFHLLALCRLRDELQILHTLTTVADFPSASVTEMLRRAAVSRWTPRVQARSSLEPIPCQFSSVQFSSVQFSSVQFSSVPALTTCFLQSLLISFIMILAQTNGPNIKTFSNFVAFLDPHATYSPTQTTVLTALLDRGRPCSIPGQPMWYL